MLERQASYLAISKVTAYFKIFKRLESLLWDQLKVPDPNVQLLKPD